MSDETILTGAAMRNQPTHEQVRNILGLPCDVEPFDPRTLPDGARRDWTIYLLSRDLHDLKQNGCVQHGETCQRVTVLETFKANLIFGTVVLAGAGGVVAFLLLVSHYVKIPT